MMEKRTSASARGTNSSPITLLLEPRGRQTGQTMLTELFYFSREYRKCKLSASERPPVSDAHRLARANTVLLIASLLRGREPASPHTDSGSIDLHSRAQWERRLLGWTAHHRSHESSSSRGLERTRVGTSPRGC